MKVATHMCKEYIEYEELLTENECGGYIINDDWIYWQNCSEGESLYKIKIDGTHKHKLSNDSVFDIHVNGNWIYYSTADSGNNALYKIRTDGTQKFKIDDEPIYEICDIDKWIYYHGIKGLGKIRTDGKDKQAIHNMDANYCTYSVVGNWIYFFDKSEDYNTELCKMFIMIDVWT